LIFQLKNKLPISVKPLNTVEMKILVCEDDFMMIKAIEHKLQREGYQVEVANDGRTAVEKIKGDEFDLIITDLLMPFTGGLELINMTRNELNKTTPIIVLSKVGNEETIIEAFKLGADDYLTKPFSPNELSIRVKRFLIKK
jgi:DNA-binding response OmpR family regulator